jgi:hypothetical protein
MLQTDTEARVTETTATKYAMGPGKDAAEEITGQELLQVGSALIKIEKPLRAKTAGEAVSANSKLMGRMLRAIPGL